MKKRTFEKAFISSCALAQVGQRWFEFYEPTYVGDVKLLKFNENGLEEIITEEFNFREDFVFDLPVGLCDKMKEFRRRIEMFEMVLVEGEKVLLSMEAFNIVISDFDIIGVNCKFKLDLVKFEKRCWLTGVYVGFDWFEVKKDNYGEIKYFEKLGEFLNDLENGGKLDKEVTDAN